MKNYIVNNPNVSGRKFVSEADELRDYINEVENNVKFHEVYIKRALEEIQKMENHISDNTTIMSEEFNNIKNNINKIIDWQTMPWYKKLFKSKNKFFNRK